MTSLTLRVQYDDGYVAYLNGVKIASANAPAAPTWNSLANEEQSSDVQATTYEDVDVSAFLNSNTLGHLTTTGTNVLAVQVLLSSNSLTTDGDMLVVPELAQVSVTQAGIHFFSTPTPGTCNTANNWQADTSFSPTDGFFSASFPLTLATSIPGGSIYYTTDNSEPSATHGTLYTGPFTIGATTIVRAVTVAGGQAGPISTQSYIFPADVIDQPADPAGFPTTWTGVLSNESTAANYAMNPAITGNSAYSAQMVGDLESLPTMSLVSTDADWFGPDGIYSNPDYRGTGSEVPGSMEYFDPTTSAAGYSAIVGFQMYGGVGRQPQYGKHSMAVLFDQSDGPAAMNDNLFGDGYDADRLILRSAFNDGWTWGGANSQYIIDQWTRDALTALGTPNTPGVWVQLFINGLYWGLYNAVAHIDNNFASHFYGGPTSDYTVIHSGSGFSDVAGSTTPWTQMFNLAQHGEHQRRDIQRQRPGRDGAGHPLRPHGHLSQSAGSSATTSSPTTTAPTGTGTGTTSLPCTARPSPPTTSPGRRSCSSTGTARGCSRASGATSSTATPPATRRNCSCS